MLCLITLQKSVLVQMDNIVHVIGLFLPQLPPRFFFFFAFFWRALPVGIPSELFKDCFHPTFSQRPSALTFRAFLSFFAYVCVYTYMYVYICVCIFFIYLF